MTNQTEGMTNDKQGAEQMKYAINEQIRFEMDLEAAWNRRTK